MSYSTLSPLVYGDIALRNTNTHKIVNISDLLAVNGYGLCTLFSYQNLSPNLSLLNCLARIQEKVGPNMPPG